MRPTPGMQAVGGIHLDTRTLLEFVLSLVSKVFMRRGRER